MSDISIPVGELVTKKDFEDCNNLSGGRLLLDSECKVDIQNGIFTDFFIGVLNYLYEVEKLDLLSPDLDLVKADKDSSNMHEVGTTGIEVNVRYNTADKIKVLKKCFVYLGKIKGVDISRYSLELFKKTVIQHTLTITKDGLTTTDSSFDTENIDFEVVDVTFYRNGKTIKRERYGREHQATNSTILKLACQVYEDSLVKTVNRGENLNFPIVSSYKKVGDIYLYNDDLSFPGFFCSVKEYQSHYNQRRAYCDYNYIEKTSGETKHFVFFEWSIFTSIRFVQECLIRFGADGDYFELIYTPKKEKKENNVKKSTTQLEQATIDILKKSNNIILYGPPGTGKTRTALSVAQQLAKDKKTGIKLVQFHPSVSYEDFVRGITVKTIRGTIKYEVESKIIEEFCKDCSEDNPKVLIIDEINRASLASVFGELLYGLEYRNQKINTPYELKNKDPLIIPNGLFLIGTMNTADRSIGSMDYAVRRRFTFIKIPSEKPIPKRKSDMNKQYYLAKDNDKNGDSVFFLNNIYEKVKADFECSCSNGVDPEDIMPGVSYFLVKADKANETQPWNQHKEYKLKYELIPLLKEYAKDGLFTKRKKLLDDERTRSLSEILLDNDYYTRINL